MKPKSSNFQTVLIVVFVVLAVAGAVFFANPEEKKDSKIAGATGVAVIWGTYPIPPDFQDMISRFNKQYEGSFSISYQAFDPRTFDRDIVEALASGRGPDILLLPDDLILRHADKLIPIPYTETFGQREFREQFIQASEYYLRPNGMLAYPFAIDPMVMYWNRDIFSSASIAQPPKYWDEFLTMAPKLTKFDRNQRITQSAVAFGEYDNVRNAKSILSMLFLQTGSPIVYPEGGAPVVALSKFAGGQPNPSAEMALRFYMDFSNPQKTVYSWNRSKLNSEDEFLAGNLAVYFDYASSYGRLRQKNPNLNFAVAPVPQLRDRKTEITIARLHGLAALKSSKNLQTAYVVIRLLLEPENAATFARVFNLPPVRRDLLSQRPASPEMSVAYDAAIRSRTWLDPRPEETEKEFANLVDSVSSGRASTYSAIQTLEGRLEELVASYKK